MPPPDIGDRAFGDQIHFQIPRGQNFLIKIILFFNRHFPDDKYSPTQSQI
jgi:hypothetical protein